MKAEKQRFFSKRNYYRVSKHPYVEIEYNWVDDFDGQPVQLGYDLYTGKGKSGALYSCFKAWTTTYVRKCNRP